MLAQWLEELPSVSEIKSLAITAVLQKKRRETKFNIIVGSVVRETACSLRLFALFSKRLSPGIPQFSVCSLSCYLCAVRYDRSFDDDDDDDDDGDDDDVIVIVIVIIIIIIIIIEKNQSQPNQDFLGTSREVLHVDRF